MRSGLSLSKLSAKFLFCISLLVLVSACGEKKLNKEELYEKCSSGVVLMCHHYYYKLVIDNDFIFYVGKNSDDTSYKESDIVGTYKFCNGILASNKGEIVTNSAFSFVPSIDPTPYCNLLLTECRGVKYAMELEAKNLAYSALDGGLWGLIATAQAYEKEIDEFYKQKKRIDLLITKLERNSVRVIPMSDFRIAYKGMSATQKSDMRAVTLKEENEDLAVFQLMDRSTPNDKYIFPIASFNNSEKGILEALKEKIQGKSQFFMIGYDKSNFSAANTDLKPQITQGFDSLETNENEIAFHSSDVQSYSYGSPIINQLGELVAINGLKCIQENAYAVKATKLLDILHIKRESQKTHEEIKIK